MDLNLFLNERAKLTEAGVPLNEKRIHAEQVFRSLFDNHPIVKQTDLEMPDVHIRLIWAKKLPTT